MKKILFLGEKEKIETLKSINQELMKKNRLLNLLFENADHKLSRSDLNKLQNKYQEQIMLLDLIRSFVSTVKCREDIKEINRLIEQYNKLELDELIKK